MIKKSKLLICMLCMSMVLTVLPGMESNAEEVSGGADSAASELQDENSQRLEEVTAMDEDGSIYQIGETDGTVGEDAESTDENGGIAVFSARSISPQVVNFNTKGNATTSYYDETNGISGYTNGAYGADAAYLGTTGDGQIRFMLSGVTGTVSASEVELVNLDTVVDNVSYYTVSGGELLHYISQNLNSAPASALNNGPAPSYLSEGVKYYSYDGHYFYTDYAVMLNDYQSGSNGASAVNAGNPFQNYFQFLDMRSATSYSADQFESILNTAMANAWVDASTSKLTGTGSSFVTYQNTYGVNALLSLGIAVNESAWGTSWICTTKNNLFGLNAVDSSPGESADVFTSVDDCIRDFMANWMADGYLSSSDWRNHGEYLGNKGGGINVSYASDPYWGEKAAAVVWNLDEAGGSQDYLGTSVSEPDTPSTDVPETDTPATDEPTTDVPETDTPATDTPTTDVPETDTPATDEPTTDVPETDTPATDEPTTDVPETDTPTTDEPETDTPATDEPTTDEPETDTPATDTPTTDEPTTDVPTTDTPATDEPTTDVPTTDTPAADASTTDTSAADTTVTGTSTTDTPAAASASGDGTAADSNTDTTAKAPKTGDSQDAYLWIMLLGLSAAAGAVSVVVMRRKTVR